MPVNTCSKLQFLKFGLLTTCLLVQVLLFSKPSKAQTFPFMISPYFGEEIKTQDYSGGHPALDLGMNYERVIASADGTVDYVAWWNNNCHSSSTSPNDDNNCGFGLHARINYGNNYRSWYAHLSTVAYALGTTNGQIYKGQILGQVEQRAGRLVLLLVHQVRICICKHKIMLTTIGSI